MQPLLNAIYQFASVQRVLQRKAILSRAGCGIVSAHLEGIAASLCQGFHDHRGGVDIPGGHLAAGSRQMLNGRALLDLNAELIVGQDH